MADKPISKFHLTRHWSLADKIAFYSSPPDEHGCILWIGSKKPSGYGQIHTADGLLYAHHVAWRFANGPIPQGMVIRHKCDVRDCINPDHLEIGTHADNVADKVARGRATNGERSNLTKLTAAKVLEIRRRSDETPKSLGDEFGVTASNIVAILKRKSWKHL